MSEINGGEVHLSFPAPETVDEDALLASQEEANALRELTEKLVAYQQEIEASRPKAIARLIEDRDEARVECARKIAEINKKLQALGYRRGTQVVSVAQVVAPKRSGQRRKKKTGPTPAA